MKEKYPKDLFSVFFILCMFFLPHSLNAKDDTNGSNKANAHIRSDIIRGIEYLYDWKFDNAEKLFQKVISMESKDPIGYFYLSMVTWSRMAAGFWTEEVIEKYKKRIEKTISVAKKKIESGQADSFTYFYLGGSLGFKGRFQLMQYNWFSSYLVALDAIDKLKICLKMDPNNRDVLFGLGMYDYYTDRFSGFLKFLTYLFFHKGDKKEGLRKLHITANEAIYSSIEAKSLLLHIYLFLELDFHKARPIAEEMAERFKNCPNHSYLQGVTYIRLNLYSDYRKVVENYYRRSQSETSSIIASLWSNRGHYLEASYYLFHDQYDNARSELETILSNNYPESDPFMAAWPLLKIGMSYDLEGRRGKALEYYNSVIEMENGGGAQFLAEKYVNKPVVKGAPFLGF
ncbi:tetratricopeptide repeat protein [Thermodesulfobacteriota bacterium]